VRAAEFMRVPPDLAEFMRVPPDLTTATLYKYMVLRLLFPLHSWHCYMYVQTESNTQLCAL
jgi:hypothetical protein